MAITFDGRITPTGNWTKPRPDPVLTSQCRTGNCSPSVAGRVPATMVRLAQAAKTRRRAALVQCVVAAQTASGWKRTHRRASPPARPGRASRSSRPRSGCVTRFSRISKWTPEKFSVLGPGQLVQVSVGFEAALPRVLPGLAVTRGRRLAQGAPAPLDQVPAPAPAVSVIIRSHP